MAEISKPPAPEDVLANVVDLYKPKTDYRFVEEELMTMLRMIELLKQEEETLHKHDLETLLPAVDQLRDGLRASFGAVIGPLMGRHLPRAIQDIELQISIHQERIGLLKESETTDWAAIYQKLIASGLPLERYLPLEKFIEEDYERAIIRQAENFFMGPLNERRKKYQELLERFRAKGEKL